MSTSAQLPLCVYCGTARPADRSECPKCGRPWIDVRVGSLAASKVLVGAAATTETPNVSLPPAAAIIDEQPEADLLVDLSAEEVEPASPLFRRAIPIVLGLSAVAVAAMFGFGLLDGGASDEAAPDQPVTATTPTTLPPTTTATAPATTAATTTLPPTTTAPTTAPTTTIPAPSQIGAWGDPVAVDRLTLKAGGIGPIETGTPAAESIGRLVTSLGTPDDIAVAGEADGLCAGEEGRLVRWAELTAIVSGTLVDGTFVGYRYQEPSIPTGTIDLATPSGIHLGDDIATLNEVYARYTISYETLGESSTFRLFEGEELLLWGPVSSAEETGRIVGIYSPPACTAGNTG